MEPIQAKPIDESSAVSPADVYDTLTEALTHTDASIRESAAKEFSKRKDNRGISLLVETLNDEDAGVRLAAGTALNELGWRPSTDAQQAVHAVALQQFEVAAKLGEVALQPLLLPLKDRATNLRMVALETLASIGGPQSIKPIIAMLKDENSHVRAVAVQALSCLDDQQALEPLAKMVRDNSWEVRSVLLDALENFSAPRCVDVCAGFLKDEAPELRVRAIELLSRKNDSRAITSIIAALVDENGLVREAAETNLKILDANWEKTEYAKGATSSLLPALKHKDDSIREKAADTLRLIGQTRAMNSYLAAEMGTKSNTAVPVLANALKIFNRDLRQAAAEALGRTGDHAAVEPLVEALTDEDQWVREAALYSLNLLNWKPANDLEVVLKAVILQRWDSAIVFDALALEPLVMMLNCDDPEVVKSAIGALAQINDHRATEPLRIVMRHPQKIVRAAAAQALKIIGWLPSDAREGVLQAIELEDWNTVSQHGASAVEPLVTAIKENYQNRDLCDAAAVALGNISDGRAVKQLLGYSRDGQLADAVIAALTNLLEQSPGDIEADDLRALGNLSNIFQFRYTFDQRYGALVRSGLQEVDSSKLKKLALQELARRGV
jgi:HEAT repeat protein